MVATPTTANKTIISNMDQINTTKVDIMSNTFPDFCQYMDVITHEPSSMKSENVNDATLFDEWLANDLEQFLSKADDGFLYRNDLSYNVSPVTSSSMTTPLTTPFDNISQEFDSPLFGPIPTSFSTSPTLRPALGFFPDLAGCDNGTPSVTIPADDHSPLSMTIPWSSDVINAPVTIPDGTASTLINDADNGLMDIQTLTSTATSPTTSTIRSPLPSAKVAIGRSRKRADSEIEKDPEILAEELTLKRAKNTDAARRSRLRKVMKMESLETQVNELKTENNEFLTRVAVLESEKKGMEEKNAEKDKRIKMLEQQLAEAHERLINR